MSPLVVAIAFVWLQSFLIWAVGASPLVLLLVTCMMAVRLLPWAWPLSRWGTAALALVLAPALFFAAYSGADEEGHWRTVTSLGAHGLLLVQLLVLFRQALDRTVPDYLPCLGVLTFVCAFHQTIEPARQPLFLVLAVVCALATGFLFEATRGLQGRSRYATRRRIASGSVLACSAIAAWVLAVAWEGTIRRVQSELPGWIAYAAGQDQGARSYVRTGALRSISEEQRIDSMRVTLRVYANQTPGYLRGRVFDTYYDSRWHSDTRRRSRWNRLEDKHVRYPLDQKPAGIPAVRRGQELFALRPEAEPPYHAMEIHNDPDRGEIYFTPLSGCYLQGDGRFLATDDHHVVHTGVEHSAPYTVFATGRSPQEALPESLRQRLLVPPVGLDPAIRSLADEVCAGAQTPRDKMNAVSSFFQNNFAYGKDEIVVPVGREPLSHFLLERPPAHCEFFASGAVTLLRLHGVPARYVTGYVVTELEQENGDYWQARNRNAHAWAEAYDETQQRWLLVEATPGMQLPDDGDNIAGLQAGVAVTGAPVGAFAWLQEQWFSHRDFISRALMYASLLGGPAALLCMFAFLAWYRERLSARRNDPRTAQMQRVLARLERRLRRRNLDRRPHETLHHFATRLRAASGNDEWLDKCADWYLQYAHLRYAAPESQATLPAPP